MVNNIYLPFSGVYFTSFRDKSTHLKFSWKCFRYNIIKSTQKKLLLPFLKLKMCKHDCTFFLLSYRVIYSVWKIIIPKIGILKLRNETVLGKIQSLDALKEKNNIKMQITLLTGMPITYFVY